MSDPTNEMPVLRLEEALRLHAIDTSVFAPFVIARLRAAPDDTEAVLQVHMKEESAREERSLRVRLQWDPGSAFTQEEA